MKEIQFKRYFFNEKATLVPFENCMTHSSHQADPVSSFRLRVSYIYSSRAVIILWSMNHFIFQRFIVINWWCFRKPSRPYRHDLDLKSLESLIFFTIPISLLSPSFCLLRLSSTALWPLDIISAFIISFHVSGIELCLLI